MSLITSCPACATMFRVVADQLKISEGWVRCGHCGEVFDATAHLQESGAAIVPASTPDPSGEPQSQDQSEPAAPQPLAGASVPPATTQEHPASTSYPPFVLAHEEPVPAVDPSPKDSAWPHLSVPARFEPATGGEGEDAETLEDLSFVRQARRRAFWRRGSVRALLVLLLLLLGGLLAAQVAVVQRDRLAVTRPALVPMLQMLCEALACKIGPPRQIDAVAIDSSTFNRLRGDTYRLSFTLKNQASHEVAMPALELTLTDTQDQPVLRRVIAASELGPSTPVTIGTGSEWSTTLALGVGGNGVAGRIVGYRLLAFYP